MMDSLCYSQQVYIGESTALGFTTTCLERRTDDNTKPKTAAQDRCKEKIYLIKWNMLYAKI